MDEQLALRLGALRLARRRGRLREAAWAAARLRLAGVSLGVGEARFARDTRIRFGRALRSARIRMTRPAIVAAAAPLTAEAPRRADRRRLFAVMIAAAMLMAALFFYIRVAEPEGAPEGAKPSTEAVVVTPPPQLKGRSQPGAAAPVAIVEQTAAPESPPTITAPGTGTGVAGGGPGAGGSGNGTGIGNGRGTPAPTPQPTPAPTPIPTPVPKQTFPPGELMHVSGYVWDSVTRVGVPDVCISVAILSCPGEAQTDSTGFYAVDLWIGQGNLRWGITYIKSGYRSTGPIVIAGRAGNVTQNVFLRKGP